jgi:hypothetical protein
MLRAALPVRRAACQLLSGRVVSVDDIAAAEHPAM